MPSDLSALSRERGSMARQLTAREDCSYVKNDRNKNRGEAELGLPGEEGGRGGGSIR